MRNRFHFHCLVKVHLATDALFITICFWPHAQSYKEHMRIQISWPNDFSIILILKSNLFIVNLQNLLENIIKLLLVCLALPKITFSSNPRLPLRFQQGNTSHLFCAEDNQCNKCNHLALSPASFVRE